MFINEVPNNDRLPSIIINELRDIYGIKYRKEKKSKPQQLSCHQKIFGVPLKELEFTEEKLSNGSSCRIPIFVADACARIMDQIEVEGIFRKAGSTLRQKEIREKLEKGIPLDESCNVVDIANILKYFFRELPEPLLPPGNFQEAILRCLICKGTQERRITAIKMVCLLLPNVCLNTLVYFMQFLNLVSLHSTANKMSAKNLAIIFTPGLMPVHENFGQRLTSHVQVIELLIENAHEIGVVPSEVLVRLPNMSTNLLHDPLNFTMAAGTNSRRSIDSNLKVPETDIKKKKKRRSGSLTRMFNGIRKIVGAIGSSENLDVSHDCEVLTTPCINKSKKRKVLESNGFSSKKKKDVLALLPTGGILPSTPMVANKPTKKARLSLGGKRYSKNGSQPSNQSNGTKSSIVSSLERRWSFMVTGSNNRSGSNKSTLNTIKDTSVISTVQKVERKDESWEAQITKSEYEEIKDRVKAIESRISEEFTKIQSSISNNSLDSVDMNDPRDGPERVLEKFEKTLEDTEMMNTSPMTEQLARRLSRGLKIRSSIDNKIFRSPSARKIGSIRRRSQENVRLTRNKSWHLGSNVSSPLMVKNTRVTRNSPLQPTITMKSPNIDKQIQIPRVNLKRGRPNTFPNGVRSTQPDTKATDNHPNTFTVTDNHVKVETKNVKTETTDFQNEKWICADVFFGSASNAIEETMSTTSKNSMKSSATKPARKRLNMNVDVTPTNPTGQSNSITPRSSNIVAAPMGESTPMLPPRLPVVKKTPAKTPHPLANRNVFTPLWQQEQQQIAGRASIARLRSQNAGMVMAKAKLFDELVTEPATMKKVKPGGQLPKSINQNDPKNKTGFETTIRCRLDESTNKATDSPRRNRGGASSGVQRRQQLRAQRHTPNKKTPINLDKSLITITDTTNRRNASSPATSIHNTSMQSPMTRRMAAIEATPHSKRTALITKPPRRIIRTPQQNKRKPT